MPLAMQSGAAAGRGHEHHRASESHGRRTKIFEDYCYPTAEPVKVYSKEQRMNGWMHKSLDPQDKVTLPHPHLIPTQPIYRNPGIYCIVLTHLKSY
jgi:hypothetical protein